MKFSKVSFAGADQYSSLASLVYVDLETQGFPFTLLPRTQYNGLVEFYYILLVIPPPPPQSSTCASKTFSSVSLIHTLLTNQPSKYFTK